MAEATVVMRAKPNVSFILRSVSRDRGEEKSHGEEIDRDGSECRSDKPAEISILRHCQFGTRSGKEWYIAVDGLQCMTF